VTFQPKRPLPCYRKTKNRDASAKEIARATASVVKPVLGVRESVRTASARATNARKPVAGKLRTSPRRWSGCGTSSAS
jgi:hypothetical protein